MSTCIVQVNIELLLLFMCRLGKTKHMVSHVYRLGVCLSSVTNSTAVKGCFWEMTPTGSITRYHLFFLIEDPMGYVESVVVEKLIWSRT